MNNIEFVVEKKKDYIAYEQWLFNCEFFEKVDITMFCMEDTNSYFYTTKLVGNKWLVVTDGEVTNGEGMSRRGK